MFTTPKFERTFSEALEAITPETSAEWSVVILTTLVCGVIVIALEWMEQYCSKTRATSDTDTQAEP